MKNRKLTFKQLKNKVVQGYDMEDPSVMDQSDEIADLKNAKNLEELLGVLNGLGFNEVESYDFILSCVAETK